MVDRATACYITIRAVDCDTLGKHDKTHLEHLIEDFITPEKQGQTRTECQQSRMHSLGVLQPTLLRLAHRRPDGHGNDHIVR